VIFGLAPLQIATGAAMSPSVLARFPWYGKVFGGKQGARSLHFLGLVAFAAFVVVHVLMVIIHGVPKEFASIVLGDEHANRSLAVGIGLAGLFLILVFHVIVTWFSLRYRRRTQRMLGLIVNPFERVISRTFTSRERFSRSHISPYFRVNGYPPVGTDYRGLVAEDFATYRLQIGGLVHNPLSLSLPELRQLGQAQQITKHNCIQGWTATAEWAGVPLARVLELVQPDPAAKHIAFYAYDDKGETEGEGRYGYFYGTIPLFLAHNPQTILALGDERCPAARRARRPGPGAHRDPTRLQDGQVGQGHRVRGRHRRHRDGTRRLAGGPAVLRQRRRHLTQRPTICNHRPEFHRFEGAGPTALSKATTTAPTTPEHG